MDGPTSSHLRRATLVAHRSLAPLCGCERPLGREGRGNVNGLKLFFKSLCWVCQVGRQKSLVR
jgi:hypothetical protein